MPQNTERLLAQLAKAGIKVEGIRYLDTTYFSGKAVRHNFVNKEGKSVTLLVGQEEINASKSTVGSGPADADGLGSES